MVLNENQLEDEYLEQVERRVRAATDGPWISFVEDRDHECGSNFIQICGDQIELSGGTVADQDFIAHARQDVPMLLAEVRRLQERLRSLSR